MRLGLLGGTFDPVHLGHLRSAEEVRESFGLNKVYLIPSASPPHKSHEPVTAFAQRWDMVRLGIADSPMLEALDLEQKRPGLSYSIETIKICHAMFAPAPELFFIIGTDAFLEIPTWKAYRELFDWVHFVVISRGGGLSDEPEAFFASLGMEAKRKPGFMEFEVGSGKTVCFLETTRMDISASRIRHLIREGRSIRYLVPESVRKYIEKTGLYRDNGVS